MLGNGGGWSLYSWIFGKLPDLSSGGFLATVLNSFIKISDAAGGDPRVNVSLLLANGVFSILVCIALLLALRLLLLLITMWANAMTKGRFVGALNRLLGLVFGAARGLSMVVIVMVIMTFIMGLNFMEPVRNDLDGSVIAQKIYTPVSKLTDKFMAGNENTLTKLLDLLKKETPDEGGDKVKVVGSYTYVNEAGIRTTYNLVFRDDLTCTQSVTVDGQSGVSTRNGTYAIEGEEITITLEPIGEGGEPETIKGRTGENWIYWQDMFFVKDGEEVEAVVLKKFSVTEQNGDDTTTYVLELKSDNSFAHTIIQSSAVDSATFSGTYDIDDAESSITLSFTGGNTVECIYDKEKGAIYLNELLYVLEGKTVDYIVVGEYEATEAGDETTAVYTLQLRSNKTYVLTLQTGEEAPQTETGEFVIYEKVITLTPSGGEEREGSLNDDGTLQFGELVFAKK